MISHESMVRLQAEKHELIKTEEFHSEEEYVLHLIHKIAYEKVAKLAKNKTILDLGCNNGYGSSIISEFSGDITGVDVSQEAISVANNLYGQSGIRFQVIDGMRLPFADKKFDLIVSFHVIEHIVDYQVYFSEIKRVLSPNGMVVFTTPNAVLRLDPGMKPWNPFHVREFSASELKNLLAEYFTGVNLYGLFGNEPLYSIEFNRVKKSRYNARKKIEQEKLLLNGIKYFVRSQAKRFLPNYLVDKIRNIRTVHCLDNEFQKQYTTNDLYYNSKNLDSAIELLAICSENQVTLQFGCRTITI